MPVRFAACGLPAFICFFLGLTAVTGCASPAPTGFQPYVLDQGAGHLSFEYPSRIPVKTVQVAEDGNYTMLELSGPVYAVDRTRTRTWITVTRSPGVAPDAQLYLNSAQGVAETLPGYRFIERSKTEVSGEPAEQIIYANTLSRNDYETRVLRLQPATVINRQIYLTHGDAVWTISITASEAFYETETPDFEHLLSTFKFLN